MHCISSLQPLSETQCLAIW